VRLASARHVLFGVAALLALAAEGVVAPSRAAAQPQSTMLISPASGPCDATLVINGREFPVPTIPTKTLGLYLLQPGTTDVSMALLVPVYPGQDGTFGQPAGLRPHGCEAAALDSQASQPSGHLSIALSGAGPTVQPGDRVPNIIAMAEYVYTSTTPQLQPTIVISPASGPCNATVEVRGQNFPLPERPMQTLGLYLLQPGTTDVSMALLVTGYLHLDGTFRQSAELQEHGCEAATLDSQAEQPAGYLTIAAAPGGPAVSPGDRIPNIIAVGQYRYTATTPPPSPVIVISPSSGPCDATVEITGQDFPPNTAIELGVGGTDGELTMGGHLGSALSDGDGHLSLSMMLGFFGCAMAHVTKDQNRGDQLWLLGYVLEPGPSGRPTARTLTRAGYTFTTTESTLPIATLTLSPSSGPCDATVQATGTLFEPGSDVTLWVARPAGEGSMGTLGQVGADANGGFVTTLALGTLGCEAAAALHLALGKPNELQVCGGAYQASRCAVYTPTTTAVSPEPHALPSTGSGPSDPSLPLPWLALTATLAGLGLTLVAVSLYQRRQRS